MAASTRKTTTIGTRRAFGACAVLVVLVAAAYFRARFADSRGLWLDECGTLWAARGADWHETVDRVLAVQGQSPLYYLIERAAIAVLGETEARIRLTSIVLGTLVPLLGYVGAARAFGRRAGAAVLLILAFDPALIWQAEQARPYPLAEAGALLSFLGVVRAVETGRALDRFLAWGGAVLAIYGHYVFVPILPALVLGVVASEKRAYSRRDLLLDVAIAVLALVPALRHMTALFQRRHELEIVHSMGINLLYVSLPPWVRWWALAGAVFAIGTGGLRMRGRGPLAFAFAGGALTSLAIIVFLLLGSNMLEERYLALGATLMPVVAGWAISRLPAPIAALGLSFVCAQGMQDYDRRWLRVFWHQEWREAAADLRSLEPRPEEPILLWTGFIEANLVAKPGRVTPQLRSFLASPLEDHPGHPESGRPYLLLAYGPAFYFPEQPVFYEAEVVPRLAAARRFFMVVPKGYKEEFEKWLGLRFPEVWKCVRTSRVYNAPVLVAVYERR